MQGKVDASIGAGFYTQNYRKYPTHSLQILSCISHNGTQYFNAARFGRTDIAPPVVGNQLAQGLHKQEMVSQRCRR
jgi:hypothetical protein